MNALAVGAGATIMGDNLRGSNNELRSNKERINPRFSALLYVLALHHAMQLFEKINIILLILALLLLPVKLNTK